MCGTTMSVGSTLAFAFDADFLHRVGIRAIGIFAIYPGPLFATLRVGRLAPSITELFTSLLLLSFSGI